MIQKYFPFDKNYLLEKAQLSLERELIVRLIDRCKEYYLFTNNPLGLVDDTIAVFKGYSGAFSILLRRTQRAACGKPAQGLHGTAFRT
ncbi:MAG: hypothetical protein P8X57_11430 [Cyclobacteriaceae bacterium]